MNRRIFVRGGAVIAGSQVLQGQGIGPGAVAGQQPTRMFRLFDHVGANQSLQVQTVLLSQDLIYCIFSDSSRQYGLSVTAVSGERRSQRPLPPGVYTGLGVQGRDLLIQAVNYSRPTSAESSCILRFRSEDGVPQFIAPLPTDTGKLHFAGDSLFLGVSLESVTLWSVSGSSIRRELSNSISPIKTSLHVDLLDRQAALTRADGGGIISVRIPTGETNDHPILIPELRSALAAYEAQTNDTGRPVVIPSTGSDQGGNIYGLILPAPPATVPVAKFDITGNGSLLTSIQLSNTRLISPPLKLLLFHSEMGVVFADGNVAWYAI